MKESQLTIKSQEATTEFDGLDHVDYRADQDLKLWKLQNILNNRKQCTEHRNQEVWGKEKE